MKDELPRLPRSVRCNGHDFEIRLMNGGDAEATLAFARELPPHDLLFLQRDIRNPKVVAAWIEQIERGTITSLLATAGGRICGCVALVRDDLSWSRHVGELRVVLDRESRGAGLGRILVQDAFALAVTMGVEKLVARMTADQRGAIGLFEEMGFRAEALLRDYVRDEHGVVHDIVILSLDVARHRAQLETYGYGEAF